jgi:predicted RNase H-related nuclease YkuK (DUF458 family)
MKRILKFEAEWCTSCKSLSRILEGMILKLPIEVIDIDLNPDPKYKSNEVFRQAVGLVEGMGYEVRYKTLGPIATYAADHLVKI